MIEVSEKTKKQMQEGFTKYEIARILGARALQLAMNAPILIKLDKEDLEKINYDPLKIAEFEFFAGILPITVKRPMPPKTEEKIILKEKPKLDEKESAEKKEEAKKEQKVVSEEKVEDKIVKEVEGTEIMELAKPEDEVEEEVAPELEE